MAPELIIKATALDLELTEMLGKKPGDFLILCFDGVPFEPFGSPWDQPRRRADWEQMIDGLNNRTRHSLWPTMFKTWGDRLVQQYNLTGATGSAKDKRPDASFQIHRVCASYSARLHCAVGLIEDLGTHLTSWTISRAPDGEGMAVLQATGDLFIERSESLPLAIATAAKRLLQAYPLP